MKVWVDGELVEAKVVTEVEVTRYVRRWKWLPFFWRKITMVVPVKHIQLSAAPKKGQSVMVMYDNEC